MNPPKEVVLQGLWVFSDRRDDVVRQRGQHLDLIADVPQGADQYSDGQRWERREIIEIYDEDAAAGRV